MKNKALAPVLKKRGVIKGICVAEAMDHQVIQLPNKTPIRQCIRHIIKFKTNAVMVTDMNGIPLGVVSKTDIMGAYYAQIPVDTPISDIMVGSPYYCHPKDPLESAIDHMQTLGIHQLYVHGKNDKDVVGILSYSNIVGMLYRYCRHCVKSVRSTSIFSKREIPRLTATDVMTHDVISCDCSQPITQVIEILSEEKKGALLVTSKNDSCLGIISKTDLLFAYIREVPGDTPAQTIMNAPVNTCLASDSLSEVIQQMLLYDIQRIFVRDKINEKVNGVLSLSDAARFRSGTCKACGPGRVISTPIVP